MGQGLLCLFSPLAIIISLWSEKQRALRSSWRLPEWCLFNTNVQFLLKVQILNQQVWSETREADSAGGWARPPLEKQKNRRYPPAPTHSSYPLSLRQIGHIPLGTTGGHPSLPDYLKATSTRRPGPQVFQTTTCYPLPLVAG